MFSLIRQHRFFKLFWLMMALYLANISVDAPDPAEHLFSENLEYNDIESIAEFVLETVLSIENAVPEHDDPDRDDDASKKGKKAFAPIVVPDWPAAIRVPEVAYNSRIQESSHRLKSGRIPEILSPPPQA